MSLPAKVSCTNSYMRRDLDALDHGWLNCISLELRITLNERTFGSERTTPDTVPRCTADLIMQYSQANKEFIVIKSAS